MSPVSIDINEIIHSEPCGHQLEFCWIVLVTKVPDLLLAAHSLINTFVKEKMELRNFCG